MPTELSPETPFEDTGGEDTGGEDTGGEDRAPTQPLMLFISGAIFLSLTFALFLVAHWYVGRRLIADPAWPEGARLAGWCGLWLLCATVPVGPMSGRILHGKWARYLQWAGYLWLGAFGLFFVAVVASDALALVARLAVDPGPDSLLAWRRAQALGVLGVVIPALVVGFLTARGRARVENVELSLPHLGPAFDGFRIAQISDLHVGQTLDGRWLRRVVEQVNGLLPDAVAITGDLVDAAPRHARHHLEPLASLRATHGAYYVTGNHEYYHGGPIWEREVGRRGVTVLHNEHRVIARGEERLIIAGVTDHDAHLAGADHASSPARALEDAPEGVRILLAHQPRTARRVGDLKVDLQLSGHTHGGQMFPWMYLVLLQQPVIRGLKHVAGVRVYTNRGTGYWGPPIRLGPAPEITLITLRRA